MPEQEQEILSGKDRDAFISDTAEITTDLIHKLVEMADKHNVDCDNAVQYFASMFKMMVEISTFENYGKGEAADDH